MMSDTESKRAPEPVGPYPHAKKVGPFLFISGMGPRKAGSKEIPGVTLNSSGEIVDYDIEAQTRSVFENIRVVIEDAGADWEQLVDITVFLTNMKDDFKTFNKVYLEHFPKNRPCRTTVEVGALPTPIAVELKCLLYLGE